MSVEKQNKPELEIQNLKPYLSDKTQEELDEILAYGERMKAEVEEKKKQFWKHHTSEDFRKLLKTKWDTKDIEDFVEYDDVISVENEEKEKSSKDVGGKGNVLKKIFGYFSKKLGDGKKENVYVEKNKEPENPKYKYLCKMNHLERKKFVEEYLYDNIFYSEKKVKSKRAMFLDYEKWKNQKTWTMEGLQLNFVRSNIGADGVMQIVKNLDLKKWMGLHLQYNEFGAEGAEALAQNLKFKEGVELNLFGCKIGVKGAEAVSYMELQDESTLDLGDNQICAVGAKAIAENMKMKFGVTLNLPHNQIGDVGVTFIAENMKLEKGVSLDLSFNEITPQGVSAIAENMKLQEGVELSLRSNTFGDEGAKIIAKMELQKGVSLNLSWNKIGVEGIKEISHMKLKEGVELNLDDNEIGVEGVKELVKNMELELGVTLNLGFNKIGAKGAEVISHIKLKEGVTLDLNCNDIGDEGARIIAENMKLEDGVHLDLHSNKIGDEGANAIIENMKLREGMVLNLKGNKKISDKMKKNLIAWEKSYEKRGINCEVLVD